MMKKLLMVALFAVCATAMHAGLALSIEGYAINADTTITISTFSLDKFTNKPVMGFSGMMLYQGGVTVYIERPAGVTDQLCAGSCQSGNKEALDTMSFNTALYSAPIQVYSHYYPTVAGTVVIKYRFVGDGDDFTLTVNYVYDPTALQEVSTSSTTQKFFRQGHLIIKHNGKEYDAKGNLNHE